MIVHPSISKRQVFLPAERSYRIPNTAEGLLAPANLDKQALQNPNAKHYYFKVSQVKFPHVVQATKSTFQFPGGGTAFVVRSDGYLVTNAHVYDYEYPTERIRQSDFLKLNSREEISLRGSKLIYKSRNYNREEPDLALLYVPAIIGRKPLQIIDKLPDSEEVLFLVGYPNMMGGEEVISIGNSQGMMRFVNGVEEYLETDNEVSGGNSGSPLMDNSGQVYGVFFHYSQSSFTIGAYHVPAFFVKRVLEKQGLWPQI